MLRGGNNETDPESYERFFFFFTIASYCVPIPVNYNFYSILWWWWIQNGDYRRRQEACSFRSMIFFVRALVRFLKLSLLAFIWISRSHLSTRISRLGLSPPMFVLCSSIVHLNMERNRLKFDSSVQIASSKVDIAQYSRVPRVEQLWHTLFRFESGDGQISLYPKARNSD